jgi:hypothetical protein
MSSVFILFQGNDADGTILPATSKIIGVFNSVEDANAVALLQPVPLYGSFGKWNIGYDRQEKEEDCYGSWTSGLHEMWILRHEVTADISKIVEKNQNMMFLEKMGTPTGQKWSMAGLDRLLGLIEAENLVIMPEGGNFSYGYAIFDPETRGRLLWIWKNDLPKGVTFKIMSKSFDSKRNRFMLKLLGFPEIKDEEHYVY